MNHFRLKPFKVTNMAVDEVRDCWRSKWLVGKFEPVNWKVWVIGVEPWSQGKVAAQSMGIRIRQFEAWKRAILDLKIRSRVTPATETTVGIRVREKWRIIYVACVWGPNRFSNEPPEEETPPTFSRVPVWNRSFVAAVIFYSRFKNMYDVAMPW